MNDQATTTISGKIDVTIYLLGAASIVAALVVWPRHVSGALFFAFHGLIEVAPLVVPGVLLAAWIIASGADALIERAFEGRLIRSVLVASAIGAITPVCGVTVLPMMAGLLAARVPLAPVMAFWLSSPVTDPAMLATTAVTLGLTFAIGKTVAAFGLGVLGGAVAAVFAHRPWASDALRDTGFARKLRVSRGTKDREFDLRFWKHESRRLSFCRQTIATTNLILICLIPAFVAEYALNETLTPGALTPYLSGSNWWSIPAAVLVGAPAYLNGYAALPLTRSLIENGMSHGAAMAFLVSGGAVSIWGALAILPVLKMKPFILYLALAIVGSLLAGYAFEWITRPSYPTIYTLPGS